MKFINFKSGSKGNTSFFVLDNFLFLIDVGFNKKELKSFLSFINKKEEDINYIFLTHTHSDHIKGIKYIDKSKLYFINDEDGLIRKENIIKLYKELKINDFIITPIKTLHDVISCGYIIKYKNIKFGYITDTGYIPIKSLKYLKNLDYYYFESNHDIMMLIKSKRTDELKERILSVYGHLSNDTSYCYLNDLVGNKTKKVVFAHLSEECNEELTAQNKLNKILGKNRYFKNIKFSYAKQNKETIIDIYD